jgi:hypothetical protein
VVDPLTSRHEALSSSSNTTKKETGNAQSKKLLILETWSTKMVLEVTISVVLIYINLISCNKL